MLHNNNIEMWQHIVNRCSSLSSIEHMLYNGEVVARKDLYKLAIFAVQFGEQGKSRFLQISESVGINKNELVKMLFDAESEAQDTSTLCSIICGEGSKCDFIKSTNRSSPLFVPNFDPGEFDESEAIALFLDCYGKDIVYHHNSHQFYEYSNGVWIKLGEERLKMLIERTLMSFYDSSQVKNTYVDTLSKRLKKRHEIFFEGDFNCNKFILNFKNGLFDLQAQRLLPHKREYKSTVQFPVEYIPEAKCNLFNEKISEILDNNDEVIDFFLKWMLYTLLPTYEYQKALLLIGKGGNGKSVLLDLWGSLLGRENTSNQEFYNLADGRNYSMYQLMNKYANFSKEISSLEKESYVFKALTGNDKISARQIYGRPVDFRNYARLIIASNQFPKFKILDQAILRRFDIIKFERRFDKNPDTLLSEKLIAELSGILNLIISKAPAIIQKDGSIFFESPKIVSDNIEIFKVSSDTVVQFVNANCTLSNIDNENYATTLKSLYNDYKNWCREELGTTPKPMNVFKDQLENLINCETFQVNSVKTISGKIFKKVNWVMGIRKNLIDNNNTAIAEPIIRILGLSKCVEKETAIAA